MVLFIAMLGMGILQNPMFGDGTPSGLAYLFPRLRRRPHRHRGRFSQGFHALAELVLAGGWLLALAAAVALTLNRSLATT